MGNSFRQQPGPTLYGDNKTPVSEDLLEVGVLVAVGMIAFSFGLIIIGIRGWERLFATVRVFVALWIGAAIVVSVVGHGWYYDRICTRTAYKNYIYPTNIRQEIEADVGIHIGLLAVNITLHENECEDTHGDYESPFPDEEIDYNEQYSWANPWAQGRFGFGLFAGRLSREFRATQFRGTPLPIQWIAEYFTLDGEKIRWGRKFRQAGWYTHILLWISFSTYVLAMLLYIFVIRHGAWFTIITGLLMIFACFAFGVIIINDPEFEIPFQDDVLEPKFGWSWWLTLWTGLATFFLGWAILALDIFKPEWTAAIFHHSLTRDDEFFQVEEDEDQPKLEEYGVGAAGFTRGGIGRSSRGRTRRGLKKRSTVKSTRGSTRHGRGGDLEVEIQLEEVGPGKTE